MAARNKYPPNRILRRLREERGWSLQRVANELCRLAEVEDKSHLPGVNANMVGVWERGWKRPSPFYQELFCQLYARSVSQLGFVHQEIIPAVPQAERQPKAINESLMMNHVPQFVLSSEQSHAIDMVCHTLEVTQEQHAGAWLTLGTSGLAQLLNEGWTLDDILSSLQVVLSGMQALPAITRRRLLQMGGAAMMRGIKMPTGERVSEEERIQLCHALGQSVGSGWNLFHSASNLQVLAVGQAQLYFVQKASPHLYPGMRTIFYSSIHNLIGAAYHFQGRYSEAHQAHEQAYIAALEGLDVLSMAQSRSWQANGLRQQGKHREALQAVEGALRLISSRSDRESIRLQAHLFASGAEIAALLGEHTLVQKHLEASQALLSQLPCEYNDQFDHVSWHQYKGTCALIFKQNEAAVAELQQAITNLPAHSMIRLVTTLLPLAIAYARSQKRENCFETAKKAADAVKVINAPGLSRQFVEYIHQEILTSFPDDQEIKTFAADIGHQLLPGNTNFHLR